MKISLEDLTIGFLILLLIVCVIVIIVGVFIILNRPIRNHDGWIAHCRGEQSYWEVENDHNQEMTLKDVVQYCAKRPADQQEES